MLEQHGPASGNRRKSTGWWLLALTVALPAFVVGSFAGIAFSGQAQEPTTEQPQPPEVDSIEAGFGIKEALLIAAEKAVELGSAADAFLASPDLRIPLPAGLEYAEDTLRRFGLGAEVDDLLLAMNRAAEHSAGEALSVLAGEIREADLGDPLVILRGQGSAATTSFQASSEQRLVERLAPVVGGKVEKTGVADAYRRLVESGGNLVTVAGVSEKDLAPHVTEKTVQGLLLLMAAQELAIRGDPAARETALLQRVFGAQAAVAEPALVEPGGVEPEPAVDPAAGPQDERQQALTEALLVGALRAIGRASLEDGYYGNQLIRIPLPEKLQKIADKLRDIGLDQLVDELELSINRAAEQAAPEAIPIFKEAVKSVTFGDLAAILTGGEAAATGVLRSQTEQQLTEVFSPVIAAKMEAAGVTRSYNSLMDRAGPLLMLFGLEADADLPSYVTAKALDGLFTLLAEEEAKIREDPVARTTDLLQRIFGSLGG